MMLLVDFARDDVGVAMGSRYVGKHIGWTTDEAKAARLREAGAHVQAGYNAAGPCGWEITIPIGSKVTT